MTKLSAPHASRLRATIVAVAMAATLTLPAAANATFEGKSGPIAFQRISDLNDPDSSDIVRVDPRSGKTRQLTDFPGLSWFPDYSPNGKRIAFTRSNVGGRDALFEMKADGSHPVQLNTECSGECLGDSSSAWAPSGRRIVFERAFGPVVDDTAARLDLYIAKANGSRERRIPLDLDGQEPHDAQWSPNGQRLAVNVLNGADTAALNFIFRALFLLYAESAGYLPMSNQTYAGKSMTRIAQRAAEELDVADPRVRVGDLRVQARRIRPAPDHAAEPQRRQSGLVAERQADRLQLLL